MDASTGITMIKIFSMVSTATFAILGTLTDFKKDGKVTFWGRVSIIGVILSATFSGISLGFEQQKNLRDSMAANEEKAKLNQSLETLTQNASQSLKQINDLFAETKDISRGVGDNLKGQERVLSASQEISKGMTSSLFQQGNILDQVRDQIVLQGKTYEKTGILQNQQGLIAEDMHRSLTSFSSFKVLYGIRIPFSSSDVIKNYAAYVKSQAESFITPDSHVKIQKRGGDVIIIEFEPNSTLPEGRNDEERYLVNLLSNTDRLINFSKTGETFDLALEFRAWLSTSAMEKALRDRDDITIPIKSQNVRIRMKFVAEAHNDGPSIDLEVGTNIIGFSQQLTNKITSFADLPGSLLYISTPCGTELEGFSFRTGVNYGTVYSLPRESFRSTETDASTFKRDCWQFMAYRLKTEDFPFYWNTAQK